MASVKIVQRKKALSDGQYPIALQIIKGRKSKLISLGLKCQENEFGNQEFKKNHSNFRSRNRILLNLKSRALEIIDEFKLNGKDFTLEEFEQKFRGNQSSGQAYVYDFFDEIVDEYNTAGRTGNANVYIETKKALLNFHKNKKLSFSSITTSFLEKFEAHMRSRKNSDGGISIKMRTLRSLFNKAINRDLIPESMYPFKKYKISKLKPQPKKRALTIDEFKKIRDLDIMKIVHVIDAYHYFIFSFYSRGMNFVDMMKLKWSDIQNGRIYYQRSKTKKMFSIEVNDKLKEILQYYKTQNNGTDYVFPILLRNNLTPKQIEYRKKKTLSTFNRNLKELARIAGVDKNLTSYVARHSFATILKQTGTNINIISELMGHADVQVTMSYLKDFDNDVLDDASRNLLNL